VIWTGCEGHTKTKDVQDLARDQGLHPNEGSRLEEAPAGMGIVIDIPYGKHGMIHL
jgi:hypothetical protein